MKKLLIILIFIIVIFFSINESFADCRGCCSSHGGVVCSGGVTKCADGAPLSKTCKNKGCNKFSPTTSPPSLPNISCNGDNYTVERIIDGDTFVLTNGHTVRLIGIDTPEVGEVCSSEATKFLASQIDGKTICLSKDVSDIDRYGRWLRYAFTDRNTFINRLLVIEGYAYAREYPPDVKYATHLSDAEGYAADNSAGCLWESDSDASWIGCFINIIEGKH